MELLPLRATAMTFGTDVHAHRPGCRQWPLGTLGWTHIQGQRSRSPGTHLLFDNSIEMLMTSSRWHPKSSRGSRDFFHHLKRPWPGSWVRENAIPIWQGCGCDLGRAHTRIHPWEV